MRRITLLAITLTEVGRMGQRRMSQKVSTANLKFCGLWFPWSNHATEIATIRGQFSHHQTGLEIFHAAFLERHKMSSPPKSKLAADTEIGILISSWDLEMLWK